MTINKHPLISVITVAFNAASTIEQTILSVINQTYSNIEYIIIDGGSADGTVDIIKKYEDKIAYWISEPDKGIYDAMNKGIDIATGEWINFMNCGDAFYDYDILANIFSNKISESIHVIYGNIKLKHFNDSKIQKAFPINTISYRLPFCHQACFVKSKVALQFKFDLKYKIAGDYNCIYHIFYSYGESSFKYIDECIATFDMTDSFSLRNSYRHWLEYLDIRSSHKDIRWFYDMTKKYIKLVLGYNKKYRIE